MVFRSVKFLLKYHPKSVYSIDESGGLCFFSSREQLCILSDTDNTTHEPKVKFTPDGFLFVMRGESQLRVFDAHAMTLEKYFTGAEAQGEISKKTKIRKIFFENFPKIFRNLNSQKRSPRPRSIVLRKKWRRIRL